MHSLAPLPRSSLESSVIIPSELVWTNEVLGKTVHGRKVVVRAKKFGDDLRDCQILFISHSERKRFEQILNAVRGAHVLTVGESEGFLETGGALNFVVVGDRVRFDANLAVVSRENLRISSQLLMLARTVLKDSSVGSSGQTLTFLRYQSGE